MSVLRSARRAGVRLAALASTALLTVSGCAAKPPPAPLSTRTSSNVAPVPARLTQIIVGVDSIGAGFNPHLRSDLSPVSAAVSSLVLPSAFRPVADPNTPTGSRWEMDSSLLISARVTKQQPFTVAYRIRPEASWTDNAPIVADDFWYLWQQMVTQPGVVDPAGYDLITGIYSLEAGKQAVATFARPYPAWRELFSNLLPAHIVKDVPGGFATGLTRALPVTAGQFRVENIDPQRDAILLARNDRYWGAPAKPDLILFRRAGTTAALADSLRNGDTQVAQVHGGTAALAQLSAIPGVATAQTATPRVMELTLQAGRPKLADERVRRAILGLLDVELLGAVGAGADNSFTPARAQVRVPSDPGYVATAPAAITTAEALALLQSAGYRHRPSAPPSPKTASPPGLPGKASGKPPSAGAAPTPGSRPPTRGWIGIGREQLALVLGAAANDPASVAVANTAADQLRNVGIDATVLALQPDRLYREGLTNPRSGNRTTNQVDALVGWQPAGGDLATRLASRYGCTALEQDAVPAAQPQDGHDAKRDPRQDRGSAGGAGYPDDLRRGGEHDSAPSPPGEAPEAPALVRVPSNLTGICDPTIQTAIDAVITGRKPIRDVITAVEPRLWAMSAVLPIFQDDAIVAAGPSVRHVELSGPVPIGVVAGAGRWVKRQ